MDVEVVAAKEEVLVAVSPSVVFLVAQVAEQVVVLKVVAVVREDKVIQSIVI